MQLDPLSEAVLISIFIEGIRTGVDRTTVVTVHYDTLKSAVDIEITLILTVRLPAMAPKGYTAL